MGAVAAVLSQVQPPPAQAAARADGHRPVVFVHGWSGNPSTFDDMKKYFRSALAEHPGVIAVVVRQRPQWQRFLKTS
ncbi:hypothetical protein [Kitasatospora sp. NPDC057936]|uniref:hypothetical protein n=1 Tax=Kitasatospora sp. NPDC057936 TaxID=3346283 RepID=UPI0036D78398